MALEQAQQAALQPTPLQQQQQRQQLRSQQQHRRQQQLLGAGVLVGAPASAPANAPANALVSMAINTMGPEEGRREEAVQRLERLMGALGASPASGECVVEGTRSAAREHWAQAGSQVRATIRLKTGATKPFSNHGKFEAQREAIRASSPYLTSQERPALGSF